MQVNVTFNPNQKKELQALQELLNKLTAEAVVAKAEPEEDEDEEEEKPKKRGRKAKKEKEEKPKKRGRKPKKIEPEDEDEEDEDEEDGDEEDEDEEDEDEDENDMSYDEDTVKEALRQYLKDNGKPALIKLLKKYGVKPKGGKIDMSKLAKSDYESIMEDMLG